MRGFLFDENLPRVPSLQTRLPVTHALELGSRLTDSEVWDHEQQNDLAIVTKDEDFSQRPAHPKGSRKHASNHCSNSDAPLNPFLLWSTVCPRGKFWRV
jgi:hypothetical protein